MAAASEVEISTGMGKDDRSANNMIDLSLLNEVDVTCSYTSVGKDVQVVLSQEALVMKQTLTEGWDSNFRYPPPNPKDSAVVIWAELPNNLKTVNLDDYAHLAEEVVLFSAHPSRVSKKKATAIMKEKENDDEENSFGVYRDFILREENYIEQALLSMHREEEAIVTIHWSKTETKRYYLRLVDYAVKQVCCCLEGIEKGANDEDMGTKYCECQVAGYVCLLKDHTACCKCCFLTCGMIGLCTITLAEAE
jgi:hypothetical protein